MDIIDYEEDKGDYCGCSKKSQAGDIDESFSFACDDSSDVRLKIFSNSYEQYIDDIREKDNLIEVVVHNTNTDHLLYSSKSFCFYNPEGQKIGYFGEPRKDDAKLVSNEIKNSNANTRDTRNKYNSNKRPEEDSDDGDYNISKAFTQAIGSHILEFSKLKLQIKKDDKSCLEYYNEKLTNGKDLKAFVELSKSKMKLLVSNIDYVKDKVPGVFSNAHAYSEFNLPAYSYLNSNHIVLIDLFDTSHPDHHHLEYVRTRKLAFISNLIEKIEMLINENLVYTDFGLQNFRLRLKRPVTSGHQEPNVHANSNINNNASKTELKKVAEVYLSNFEDVNFIFAYESRSKRPLPTQASFQSYWVYEKSIALNNESNAHSKTCKMLYIQNLLNEPNISSPIKKTNSPQVQIDWAYPPEYVETLFDEALSSNDAISKGAVPKEFRTAVHEKTASEKDGMNKVNNIMKVIHFRPLLDKFAEFKAPDEFMKYFPSYNILSLATLVIKIEFRIKSFEKDNPKDIIDELLNQPIDDASKYLENLLEGENIARTDDVYANS